MTPAALSSRSHMQPFTVKFTSTSPFALKKKKEDEEIIKGERRVTF